MPKETGLYGHIVCLDCTGEFIFPPFFSSEDTALLVVDSAASSAVLALRGIKIGKLLLNMSRYKQEFIEPTSSNHRHTAADYDGVWVKKQPK